MKLTITKSEMGRLAITEDGFGVNDPFDFNPIRIKNENLLGNACMRAWTESYKKNEPYIRNGLGADIVETTEIVYLVAPAPSLELNMKYLNNIRRGVVVVMNEAGKYDIPSDYFFGVDPLGSAEYEGKHINKPMTGVFMVYASPHYVSSPYITERRWFIPYLYPLINEFPNFPVIPCPINVSFSALWWIGKYLKPKIIVCVGLDFYGRVDKDNMWHGYYKQPAVPYTDQNDKLLTYLKWNYPMLYFLSQAGIKVINASGGRMTELCHQLPLKFVVDIINNNREDEEGNFIEPFMKVEGSL